MNHPTANHHPKAEVRFGTGQAIFLVLLLALLVAGGLVAARATLIVLSYLMLTVYLMVIGHKVAAILAGLLLHDEEQVTAEETRRIRADSRLPRYTVLVPLYREADIVSKTISAVMELDYPVTLLEVLLLVESDDPETRQAVSALILPEHFRLLDVPSGKPKTKPRACNFGLAQATGELLVIFDAEDRPEHDQLLKAAAVFRRSPPELGCLQAKLNFYNHGDNLITRWFTLEYSTWFDLFLPGLHALRCPIPLGGTSNHFRMAALRQAGGWDAYNVTEDCDLGLELARHGIETRVLDSTTWEECPKQIMPWLKQRSRWMKGYWQTFLVHTRHPLAAVRDMGCLRYLQALVMIGGHIFTMLFNPLSWAIMLAWLIRPWPMFFPESPWTVIPVVAATFLLSINLLFIAVHALAGNQRRIPGACRLALLMPVYWTMICLGAIRGFLQFFWAPHFWDKTAHGHSLLSHDQQATKTPSRHLSSTTPVVPSRRRRLAACALLTALVVACLAATLYLPVRLKFPEQIRRARITFDGPSTQHRQVVEENWTGQTELAIKLRLEADREPPSGLFKFVAFLKVIDGEWYQFETDEYEVAGQVATVRLPLTAGWTGKDSARPWGPWCLRRVREFGIRVFPEPGFPLRQARLVSVRANATATPSPVPLTASVVTPDALQQWQMAEFAVNLSREFRNPFAPDEISLAMAITGPGGATRTLPAYYHQDYRRELVAGREVLTAVGAPGWRVRYTPEHAGPHRWRLQVTTGDGQVPDSPGGTFHAAPGAARGYVRVDPQDPRFFAFANGEFYYPICLNIRSPSDNLRPRDYDYPYPDNDAGTFAYDQFFAHMRQGGIDLGRVWMAPWFGSIEWHRDLPGFHGLREYNLQNAWRLDYLLTEAQRQDLLLELVLHHHGPFMPYRGHDSQWPENPYNRANGGELERPEQVLTSLWARRLFQDRMRYLAARYGAFTSLFAWVLWIEIDAFERNQSIQAEWHRDIAPWFRQIDLDRHPISTEFQSATGSPVVWQIPEISYTQLAAYSQSNGNLVGVFQQRAWSMARYGKPAIIEEYGGTARGGSMAVLAQEIHDGLWAGWMLPLSGSPMAWWWNFIFAKDLTRHYAAFADYIHGEDLRGHADRFVHIRIPGSEQLAVMARIGRERAYAWVHHHDVTNFGFNPQRRHHPAPDLRRHALPGYDPVNDLAPTIFPDESGHHLRFKGMANGEYRIEFWDTWQRGEPTTITATCADGMLVVPLPEMTRDLALKVKPANSE